MITVIHSDKYKNVLHYSDIKSWTILLVTYLWQFFTSHPTNCNKSDVGLDE